MLKNLPFKLYKRVGGSNHKSDRYDLEISTYKILVYAKVATNQKYDQLPY